MKLDMDIKNDVRSDIGDLDFNSPILAQKKPFNRFIVTSGLVHIITATAIILINHVPQEIENELVEIEFSPSAINSAPEIAPLPDKIVTAEEPQQAPLVAPIPEPKTPEPVALVKPLAKSVAPKISHPVAPPPIKSTPATLDDIQIPNLDDSALVAAKSDSKLNPQDLDEDLNQVDQQHEKQLEAVSSQIAEETDDTENSLTESANSAAEHLKKEKEAAAAAIAARAEALRKEEADAQAQARAKAQEIAQAQAETEAPKNAGPGPVNTEVRALEQLRQMPGNPKPQYGSEERLRGDQGVIILQAFVTQQGNLSDFKLLQSTGHRNLDAKTLKALKQWRFYPGQEGWVELPFNWNLKGGPQEMPAFLRRKVGKAPKN